MHPAKDERSDWRPGGHLVPAHRDHQGTRPTSGLNHVHLKVATIVDEKLDSSSSPERGVDDFEQGEQAGHFGLVVWGQIAPGGASL